MTARSRGARWLTLAGVIALAGASVGLFFVSRGKWSDAIIDSGREWIVPDALARGDLLYRDVVYWFGPFTPYFHAAFFRVFGSSFATLVLAGIVGSIGVLAALYFALRAVTERREAVLWTALAIPALVLMPNAGGPILGMGYRIWHAAAFALAAIALASKPRLDRRPILRAAGVGLLCALSGLCRTEWGLVALAASSLAFWFGERSARERLPGALALGGAFLVLFGGTIGAFIAAAGWKAVVVDGHVLLTGLPAETRTFLVEFSGVRDWRSGVLELLYSAATWTGGLLVLQILAIGGNDRARVRGKLLLLGIALLVVVLCASFGGAGGKVLFSAAPLVCAAAAVLALASRTPWSAGLLGFGIAGALLSYRRPFHIGDAAYVGPPLLFALVCAAGLLQRARDRESDLVVRERFRTYSATAVLLLVVLAFAGRYFLYASDDRVPIPGTRGMLSALPQRVAELGSIARAVRRESRSGEGLIVFPEGELLNYLSGRVNPARHKLFIRGYLTGENEPEVLSDLERASPAVLVVLPRRTSEYGPSAFGVDYGKKIRLWIEENYETRPLDRERPDPSRGILAVRRRAAG